MEQPNLPTILSSKNQLRWLVVFGVALLALSVFLIYQFRGGSFWGLRSGQASQQETVTLTRTADWQAGSFGSEIVVGEGLAEGILPDPDGDGSIYPRFETPAQEESPEVLPSSEVIPALPAVSPEVPAEEGLAVQQTIDFSYHTKVFELGEGPLSLTKVSTKQYAASPDSIVVFYRTVATATELENAPAQQLSFERTQAIEDSQVTELSTANGFKGELGKFIQLEIKFIPGKESAFAATLPAVYELSFTYEKEAQPAEEAVAKKVQFNLLYQPQRAPTSARLILYPTEGEGLILEKDNVNFREEQGLLRLDNLELKPGSYQLEIHAVNYVPVHVVFVVNGELESYTANIGVFAKSPGAGGEVSQGGDLNGDGMVNSFDFVRFLELYQGS